MKLHFLIIAALLSTPLVSCKTTQAKKGEFKYNGLPFESYDKDGDGFISEIELDERAELAYKMSDINGDQNIDWSEFKTSKSSIKNNILAADTNGDNVVSKEELEINTKLRMMQAITDLQEKLKSSQNQAKK